MTHAIIIRMHFPDGEKFEWRLAYFQAMVLPRLLAQTDQNFDIAIRCNPIHAARLAALSPKIKPFHVKNEREDRRINRGARSYFMDFVPWGDVIGLEKYDIQSGLDSDDLVAPDYVETIVREIAKHDPEKSLHLSFQPYLFDAKTLKIHHIGVTYSPRDGSAFMSLYQPDKRGYRFIYDSSHHTLGRIAAESITLPAGKCWATCHEWNASTSIGSKPEVLP